jgi:hypothetical protein
MLLKLKCRIGLLIQPNSEKNSEFLGHGTGTAHGRISETWFRELFRFRALKKAAAKRPQLSAYLKTWRSLFKVKSLQKKQRFLKDKIMVDKMIKNYCDKLFRPF